MEEVEMWEGMRTDTIEGIVRYYEPNYQNVKTVAYHFTGRVFYHKKNPYDDEEPQRGGSAVGQDQGWFYS